MIGGGPVGLGLALALARRDFHVGIVDVRPISGRDELAQDGRSYLIAAGCWRIFEALGLGDELRLRAEPVVSVEAVGGGGSIGFAPEDAGSDDAEMGFMISASDLEAVLVRAVEAEAGIEVIAPAKVSDIQVRDNGAYVETDRGAFRAALVAGCDGGRSYVREVAGLRFEGWGYGAKAVSAYLEPGSPHDGIARQEFLKTGPIAALPMRDGLVNLVWTVPSAVADALVGMSDNGFVAELERQAEGFLPGARVVGERAAFPVGLRVAERFHAERIALAGDAAHQIHPLAGQGLNLGLKDIAALVDVICDADRVGLDIGSDAALAPYTRWRRADVVSTAAAMEGFHRVFGAPEIVRGVAGVAMSVVGAVQTARGLFAKEAAGDLGELPSLMQPVAETVD